MSVLVPGHGEPGAGGFAKDLTTPKNDVRSDCLLDEVKKPGQGAELQPVVREVG